MLVLASAPGTRLVAQTIGAAKSTAAQPVNVRDRGVMVLQPKPEADPAPVVAATPVAAAPVTPPPPVPAPPRVVPVIRECARPFAQPDVTLADAGFDKSFAGKLKGRKAVVVDLPRPYKMGGTPPAELMPWFTEMRAAGGTVTESQYCQGSRGMFGNWLGKLFGGGVGKPYKAVDGFNAVLHVYALDQTVTQVEFVPRDADARK